MFVRVCDQFLFMSHRVCEHVLALCQHITLTRRLPQILGTKAKVFRCHCFSHLSKWGTLRPLTTCLPSSGRSALKPLKRLVMMHALAALLLKVPDVQMVRLKHQICSWVRAPSASRRTRTASTEMQSVTVSQ